MFQRQGDCRSKVSVLLRQIAGRSHVQNEFEWLHDATLELLYNINEKKIRNIFRALPHLAFSFKHGPTREDACGSICTYKEDLPTGVGVSGYGFRIHVAFSNIVLRDVTTQPGIKNITLRNKHNGKERDGDKEREIERQRKNLHFFFSMFDTQERRF